MIKRMAENKREPSMEAIVDFLHEYDWLHSFSVTKFFVDEVWKAIPPEWNDVLLNLSTRELNDLPFLVGSGEVKFPASLRQFLQTAVKLSLRREPSDNLQTCEVDADIRRGMNPKKVHEVERMSAVVMETAVKAGCDVILDIGSGLGYLGQVVHRSSGFPVVGVEGCEGHTQRADTRSAKQDLQENCIRNMTFNLKNSKQHLQAFEERVEFVLSNISRCHHSQIYSQSHDQSHDPQNQKSQSDDHQTQKSQSHDHQTQKSQSHDPQNQKSQSHDPQNQKSQSHDHQNQKSQSHDPQNQKSQSHDPQTQKSKSHDQPSDSQRVHLISEGYQTNEFKCDSNCVLFRKTTGADYFDSKMDSVHNVDVMVNDTTNHTGDTLKKQFMTSETKNIQRSEACQDTKEKRKGDGQLLENITTIVDVEKNEVHIGTRELHSGKSELHSGKSELHSGNNEQHSMNSELHSGKSELHSWKEKLLTKTCEVHSVTNKKQCGNAMDAMDAMDDRGENKDNTIHDWNKKDDIGKTSYGVRSVCMIGLHCCGDLTPTMLHFFLEMSSVRALCLVSCCYHKMEFDVEGETFPNFPLSEECREVYETRQGQHKKWRLGPASLRLAAQETRSRWKAQTQHDHDCHTRHVAYRGLWELFCSKGDGSLQDIDRKIIRKADFSNFHSFMESVLKRLDLSDERRENYRHQLQEIYKLHAQHVPYVEVVTALQVVLQPVLETLVQLDRLVFLRERRVHACLMPIFEENISPRNFALVAIKDIT